MMVQGKKIWILIMEINIKRCPFLPPAVFSKEFKEYSFSVFLLNNHELKISTAHRNQ